MAVLKCKMCGGTLEIHNNESVTECDYCGTKQTLPTSTDEVITNLFNRANNLRLKCEFDKAARIYEQIVEKDDSEAEAHWGIILCKYGIEYVEDPQTMQRIPTCHRTSFGTITKDVDYVAAIDYSDSLQQAIYEKEARAIDKIQKDILLIVNNEQPFDIFICYKEADENGKRTVDSVIANDIYHQLTQEGFKVFYAAITLEDKLGQEYEPYIFAALNSAKVMLAIGTKPEYFNAVWVKNEWSRFMNFMKTDRSKLLIPCYRDMDAYDLPEEFAHLQAQDMSKIGFINDVVRGIKKVIDTKDENQVRVQERVSNGYANNVEPLLKRAFMSLEDGEWLRTDLLCEQVLNQDPENAQAYLGKLMAQLKVHKVEGLRECETYDDNLNYQKLMRFADEELKETIQGYVDASKMRHNEQIYAAGKNRMELAHTQKVYQWAADLFEKIKGYKDSEILYQECLEKIKALNTQQLYEKAISKMQLANTENDYKEIVKLFEPIMTYKNASELMQQCVQCAEEEAKKRVRIGTLLKEIKNFYCSELKEMEETKVDLLKREKVLTTEKSGVGFFEWKRKKEIEDELLEINNALQNICDKKRKIQFAFKSYIKDNERIKQIYEDLDKEEFGEEYLNRYSELWKLRVNDTFSFGNYNGEAIEWFVLSVCEEKILVISKDVLCVREFDEKSVGLLDRENAETWETSSLRRWLNDEFLNENFSNAEKEMIAISDVVAEGNSEYHISGGMDTRDKIFLPSAIECNEYKIPLESGVTSVAAREYRAKEHFSEDEYGRWWLRSAGRRKGNFACVTKSISNSFRVNNVGLTQRAKVGVRPMMWISLDIE